MLSQDDQFKINELCQDNFLSLAHESIDKKRSYSSYYFKQ